MVIDSGYFAASLASAVIGSRSVSSISPSTRFTSPTMYSHSIASAGSGDGGVLAKGAAQIAPKAPHRQDQAAGTKVPQGLFFHRVQSQGGELAVVEGDDPAAPVPSGPAQAGLALGQGAAVEAEFTVQAHV